MDKPQPKFYTTSFYLTPSDKKQMKYLTKVYGLNTSAVVRKLITEAYAILRYVEQKT